MIGPLDIPARESSCLALGARGERPYDLLMKGTTTDFVFTNPPWNQKIDGHVSGL